MIASTWIAVPSDFESSFPTIRRMVGGFYELDPLRRRVGKRVNGTLVRRWLYQNALQPVAELDANNAVVARFVYVGDGSNVPEAMIAGATLYRLIKDARGSVRLVVNASSGTIAQRLDYDEFGRVLVDSNPGFQPFGFAGGLYDPATGLVRLEHATTTEGRVVGWRATLFSSPAGSRTCTSIPATIR